MEKTESLTQFENCESKEKCEVCDNAQFKYRCPRCEVRTCSLSCVQIHKKELECSGERDKTAYIPINKFDNLHLLSDYRFLEDIDRAINNCKRNPLKKFTRYQQTLPTHLYRLKSAASKRGINLQYLPQHFTRHKENKTILDYKTQEITWKLDIIFPQGEFVKVSENVNENTRLSSVIDKYVNAEKCPELHKKYLRFYHSSGLSDVCCLLKAERAKDPKAVYMLDLYSNLSDNLKNRTVIENPVLFVIRTSFKDEYVIQDDDTEEDGNAVVGNKLGFFGDFKPITYFDSFDKKDNKRLKGKEAVKSIHSSAKLILGIDESSDEDEDVDALEPPIPKKSLIDLPTYDQLCKSSI